MVFESIINPKSAEKKPTILFIFGFIYTSIAIFLGNYIFPGNSSLPIVFLTTIFFIPLFYKTMIYEEKKDLIEESEKNILKEHSKAINFFMFLFVGITFAYMVWYIISSSGNFFLDINNIFKIQAETISAINGKAIELNISQTISHFIIIFENNLKVLIFCILFSFIYGAGAIFILTWNASVIGYALGNYALTIINTSTGNISLIYLQATSLSFLRYFIHGIPEIAAYFIGGLAGGIVSVAIIKHEFCSEKIEKIMLDVSSLILIAVIILVFSGIIEVWITPKIMSIFI
jgi:uncharacterized membrane protein SpoIIM required for sporulation